MDDARGQALAHPAFPRQQYGGLRGLADLGDGRANVADGGGIPQQAFLDMTAAKEAAVFEQQQFVFLLVEFLDQPGLVADILDNQQTAAIGTGGQNG